jgi:glycerol-3-phosphate dehydrogenase (NAD(P)+)
MKTGLGKADSALVMMPSRSAQAISRQVDEIVGPDFPSAVCAKGIEEEAGMFMRQVVEEELKGRPVGVASGPIFARETVLDYPTAATVAFPPQPQDRLVPSETARVRLPVTLSTGSFRAYGSGSVIGVEIDGAVKKMIAIAWGMVSGTGYAENSRAAFIRRGLDEMKLLSEALVGRRKTGTGLSGVDDLSLTCSNPTSRNMSLGFRLGQGLLRVACFGGKPIVVEGEMNTNSVTDIANCLAVPMQICQAVDSILRSGVGIGETFAALWSRPSEAEPRAIQISFDSPATPVDFQQLSERIL